MSENKQCPNCGEPCDREEADVGVGIIYGPWGCSCGWSESEEYNQIDGMGGVQKDGSYTDPQGGLYPKGSPVAKAMAKAVRPFTPKAGCPTPRGTATGELECPACGVRWDPLDGKPECSREQIAEPDMNNYPGGWE